MRGKKTAFWGKNGKMEGWWWERVNMTILKRATRFRPMGMYDYVRVWRASRILLPPHHLLHLGVLDNFVPLFPLPLPYPISSPNHHFQHPLLIYPWGSYLHSSHFRHIVSSRLQKKTDTCQIASWTIIIRAWERSTWIEKQARRVPIFFVRQILSKQTLDDHFLLHVVIY